MHPRASYFSEDSTWIQIYIQNYFFNPFNFRGHQIHSFKKGLAVLNQIRTTSYMYSIVMLRMVQLSLKRELSMAPKGMEI